MRDIKFRTWYEDIWMQYDVYDIRETGDWLMQFTWLIDRNWKEIYEGDIVKYKTMTGFDCGWDNWESWDRNSDTIEEEIAQVKFRNWEFYPREEARLVEDWYYSWRTFDFEVIWNIYETPNLLN